MRKSEIAGAGIAGLLLVAIPVADVLLGAGIGVVHALVAFFGFVLLAVSEAGRDYPET